MHHYPVPIVRFKIIVDQYGSRGRGLSLADQLARDKSVVVTFYLLSPTSLGFGSSSADLCIFKSAVASDIPSAFISINWKQNVISDYAAKATILEEKELVSAPIGSICPTAMPPVLTTPVGHIDGR